MRALTMSASETKRVLCCLVFAFCLAVRGASAQKGFEIISDLATLNPSVGFRSEIKNHTSGPTCVSFYAQSVGEGDVATLTVRTEDVQTQKYFSTLHKMNIGAKERLWSIEIKQQSKPFKVVITEESTTDKSSVVIEDVEITDGPCFDDKSACSFERDRCRFRLQASDFVEWKRHSPSWASDDSRDKYPAVDSTLGSSKGVYVRAEILDNPAVLVTPAIHSNRSCIRFMYTIMGEGKFEVRILGEEDVLQTFEPTDRTLLKSNLQWRLGLVDVTVDPKDLSSYKIAIAAEPSRSGQKWWAALDDIEIRNRGCFYELPDEQTNAAIIEEASCDFDGDCAKKWTAEDKGTGQKWALRSGANTNSMPHIDHTKQQRKAKFQYISTTNGKPPTDSILRGPEFDRSKHDGRSNCLSFWYFMDGASPPAVSVYLRWSGNQEDDALWARQGAQGPAWHQAYVHTPDPGNDNKGYIEFVATNTGVGSVAIDDVIAYDGPCPGTSEEFCDFENDGTCGYKGDWTLGKAKTVATNTGIETDHTTGSKKGEWTLGKAKTVATNTGIETDHTTGSKKGHYIYVDTDNADSNNMPAFESPMYPPTRGRCFKYYYHIDGPTAQGPALGVGIKREGGQVYTYFHEAAEEANKGRWSFAEINIISGRYYQVALSVYPNRGVVSVDDIQLSNALCEDSYGCDFENGYCAWRTDLDSAKNHDWVITSGDHLDADSKAPGKDVSLNTEFGHYALFKTTWSSYTGQQGILTSQEMESGFCLTFYYAMFSEDVGSLAVNFTMAGEDPQTLWSSDGSQGTRWQHAMAKIPIADKEGEYRLHFIGTVGSTPTAGADIALDEIRIHLDDCSEVVSEEEVTIDCTEKDSQGQTVQIKRSQICDFVKDCPGGADEKDCGNCEFSFDSGWCGYVETMAGEVYWASSRAVPNEEKQTIPPRPVDSSQSQTRHGDFLLVSRQPDVNAGRMLADIETDRFLGPSPAGCQLRFSYYVTASDHDNAVLKVVIRHFAEETVIFQTSKRTIFWSTVTVDIGSIDTRFKIAFLGHKNFGRYTEEGAVAIDDVKLVHCDFPPAQSGECQPWEFRCTRNACIDVNRVCDFTDDCGDRSDEANCDTNTDVTLRTSFEEGFGDWTVYEGDRVTPWSIQQGQDGGGIKPDPGRDHTLGTLYGHYMFTGKDEPEPARLISPVLRTVPGMGKCRLRLYYFIVGRNDIKTLRIYTRTSLLGEEKLIFNKFTSHGQVWNRADIQIDEMDADFQIVIEATDGPGDSFLGIDDISVLNCNVSDARLPQGERVSSPCESGQYRCDDDTCLDKSQVKECDFHNDCSDGTDEKNCGDCNFEHGMCGWHDESMGLFSWVPRSAEQQAHIDMDSTLKTSGQGHFAMLLTHSAGLDTSAAMLMSPMLKETDPRCQLSFNFFTTNSVLNYYLSVKAKLMRYSAVDDYVDIPQAGNFSAHVGQWSRFVYDIGQSDGGYVVVIKYDFHLHEDGAIAIDDIKFENCKPRTILLNIDSDIEPLTCDFKEDFCRYHRSFMESDYNWRIGKALDHNGNTSNTAIAGYWIAGKPGQYASLTSEWIKGADSDLCLTFYYSTFGTTFKVRIRGEEHHYDTLYSHHSYDYLWRFGKSTIAARTEPFMIQFHAMIGQHAENLHLAEVRVRQGKCFDIPVCDFQTDTCGYTSETPDAWTRESAMTRVTSPAPSEDHSTGFSYGYYMHITEREELGADMFRLVSASITQPNKDTENCLYFWYSLRGQDAGRMTVKLRKSGDDDDIQLWTDSGQKGDIWLQGRTTIPKNTGEYKVKFEAALTGGLEGSISLDDVEIRNGKCPQPGNCNFDYDMCGYTSHTINHDRALETESRWLRLTNNFHISNYGPSKEHTNVILNGGFAFSDQFENRFFDVEAETAMLSPILEKTEKSCVSFWFYFKGQAEGSFQMNAGELFFSTEKKSDGWRFSGPMEYHSLKPYQIQFISVRKSHSGASMAVDDVVVTEGSCDDHKTEHEPPQPKAAPKPVLKADIPVPDAEGNHPERKTNCHAYCRNWKSCHTADKHHVICVCQDGYSGYQCETPDKPKKTFQGDLVGDLPQRRKGGQSNGWRAAVAVIFTLVGVALLACVVFVFLVRTNRVRAPPAIQRMFPNLLSSHVDRLTNPVYTYSSSTESGGMANPNYEQTSDI